MLTLKNNMQYSGDIFKYSIMFSRHKEVDTKHADVFCIGRSPRMIAYVIPGTAGWIYAPTNNQVARNI